MQQPVALDVPDSPGWWAFEGRVDTLSKKYRSVGEIYEREGGMYYRLDGYGLCPVEHLIGKWYKLTMPWDVPTQGG